MDVPRRRRRRAAGENHAFRRQPRGSWQDARSLARTLHAETFAAAALALRFRIAEAERLVQALLHEIHLGAIDVVEAVAVHDDLDAAVLEHHVVGADVI